MPDADGKIRGIAITGRAAATWERIFAPRDESAKFADDCEKIGRPLHAPDQ